MAELNEKTYIRILSIAGSDSGGGAGIQADVKTIASLGCYGMTAITAITAQNTVGVTAIAAITPEILAAQIKAVVTDIGVDAVKIGMLHDPQIVRIVANAIQEFKLKHVVLDPVMIASSGDVLITPTTIEVLVQELFPLVSIITPNLDEAALLLKRPLLTRADLAKAAENLIALGAKAVLVKGGHIAGEVVSDVLLANNTLEAFASPRIASRNTHGTGCTLSAAIACYLGMGYNMRDAVASARAYILQAIAAGADVTIGMGHGPLNHGFSPIAMQKMSPPS